MRFGLQPPGREQHGHKDEQPEQGIVADLFDQGIHGPTTRNDEFASIYYRA
jgi:hypothetical protein